MVENHPEYSQTTTTSHLKGQQCLIDGTEAGAHHQQERKAPISGQIGKCISPEERNQKPSRPFHKKQRMTKSENIKILTETRQIDLDSLLSGSLGGSQRGLEPVRVDEIQGV